MDDKALVPFSDMKEMAMVLGKSGMFGKTPEQLLALMLIAQSEGIHPARAAQEYDVIQGRPALKSQSALARFQEAGGRIEWKERSDARAEAVFSHPQSSAVTISWDMAKATRMGLATKDNWKKQPGIMLQWRVVAEGVRVCYPACLNRMYLVEEVQDFEPIRNVTPESDIEALSDTRGSNGQNAPDIPVGEIAPARDGTRTEMQALKIRLFDAAAMKDENGVEVFTPDQKKDINADYHPGGKNLEPCKEHLDYLAGIVEKWETLGKNIIERRIALDQELEDGFNTALDKVD